MIELKLSGPMRAISLSVMIFGCTPVPYLSPPVRTSLGFGGGSGERTVLSDMETRQGEPGDALSVRFSVSPLSFYEERFDRRYDVGLGYVMEEGLNEDHWPKMQGAFVEGAGYFLNTPLPKRSRLRLGVISRGDLLFSSEGDDIGWGASGGLVFEYSRFLSGGVGHVDRSKGDERPTMLGVALGEVGIGLEATAEWRDVGPQSYWHMLGAITFRLPLSAGVFFSYWDESEDP